MDNKTILTNWRKPNYSIKVKLLYAFAQTIGTFISKNYRLIQKIENLGILMISRKLINEILLDLKEIAPDGIFITHQRVAGLMPICIAAEKLKIKTTTSIFSWDNLPKARLAVKTDQYLVWSEWMKAELKSYYPEISNNAITIAGTPQFEFYLEKSRVRKRADFADIHNLDMDKKWICFSGDDITTSPYDQCFLRDIGEAMIHHKNTIQIIFRRCPVDFSDRYDSVLEQYKGLMVSIDPIWNMESRTGWVGYFPHYDDIDLQVNLVNHCDLVINLGSTMALDFASCHKPCLYVNYDPSNATSWSTETIYNFQHFRSMANLQPVGWIDSKCEIESKIIKALTTPEDIGPDKETWINRLVLHPLDGNSEKISKVLT
jgi:hypothetical protein